MSGSIHKFERDMLHGSDIYISKKDDSLWSKKHWHNYFEIIYFRNTCGSCLLNGEKCEILDGSLFLLTPKDFHEITAENYDGGFALIIAFNERIIDKAILDTVTKGPIAACGISEQLSLKLSELYGVFSSKGRYREMRLCHLFNCILLEILENAKSVTGVERDISHIVRESISAMLSDPTAELSLAFFAEKFKVTESYFYRLFHKKTGVTFKRYLTDLRLEYAKQLLEENEISIIDIGYECGFNTPSQFYRAFKGAYAITPSKYRELKCSRNSPDDIQNG